MVQQGALKVFVLRDPATPFSELLSYDAVITSYDYVTLQFYKLRNYKEQFREYYDMVQNNSATASPPTKPISSLSLTLL